jgi:hypothetical protein
MVNRAKQTHTGMIREHLYEPRGGCKAMMECRDEEIHFGACWHGKESRLSARFMIRLPPQRTALIRKTPRS